MTWDDSKVAKTAEFVNADAFKFIRLYIDTNWGTRPIIDGSAAEMRLRGTSMDPLASLGGTANFTAGRTPITQATLTLTVPAAGLDAVAPLSVGGTGWSTSGPPAVVDTDLVFTFTFSGTVSANTASPNLTYTLKGDGVTPRALALPKVATNQLTGAQFDTVVGTTTWN